MKQLCCILLIILVFTDDMEYNNMEDVIEYLARGSTPQPTEISLLEKKSKDVGCEAMNNCSGHGICQNGTCVCDRGWDYFDCSVKIPSMSLLI
jgi:hypothetical protein